MPPVVVGVAVGYAAAGSVVAGVTITTAGAVAIGVAAAAATHALTEAMKPELGDFDTDALSDQSLTTQANQPRKIIYGEAVVGGQLVGYGKPTIEGQDYHVMVIHLVGHPCESVEILEIEGRTVAELGDAVTATFHTGEQTVADQTAFDHAEGWTTEHVGVDQTYVVLKIRIDPDVFPNGVGDAKFKVKGKKVYDPRKDSTQGGSGLHRADDSSTWEWSDNPELCAIDCMRHYGARPVPLRRIPWDFVATAANYCDEQASYTDREGNPQTGQRFGCNGVLNNSIRPGEMLNHIMSTMGAKPYRVGGKIYIKPAMYAGPATLTINVTEASEMPNYRPHRPMRERNNTIRAEYMSPEKKWQMTSAPVVHSPDYKAKDKSHLESVIRLNMVTKDHQAQRLGKLKLERSRAGFVASYPLPGIRLDVVPGTNILFVDEETQINKEFLVEDAKFNASNNTTELALVEDGVAIYPDSFEPTEGDLTPNTTLPDTTRVAAVTSISFTQTSQDSWRAGFIIAPHPSPSSVTDWEVTLASADGQQRYAPRYFSKSEHIDLTGLAIGEYGAYVRVKNRFGVWSPELFDTFEVTELFGAFGSEMLTGEGAPNNTQGSDGDTYWDLASGKVYRKAAGAWSLEGNLAGADGDKWHSGTSNPTASVPADATNGDMFINTTTHELFQLVSDEWLSRGVIRGPKGIDAVDGSVESTEGLAFYKAPNGGAWTPAARETVVTFRFYRANVEIATRQVFVSCSADGSLNRTVWGGTGEATVVSASGVNTGALTLTVTHSNSGTRVSANVLVSIGGDKGADGKDGKDAFSPGDVVSKNGQRWGFADNTLQGWTTSNLTHSISKGLLKFTCGTDPKFTSPDNLGMLGSESYLARIRIRTLSATHNCPFQLYFKTPSRNSFSDSFMWYEPKELVQGEWTWIYLDMRMHADSAVIDDWFSGSIKQVRLDIGGTGKEYEIDGIIFGYFGGADETDYTNSAIANDKLTINDIKSPLNWSAIPESGANKTTNTNQLEDGAKLGEKADWGQVTGLGKPADDANKIEFVADGTLGKVRYRINGVETTYDAVTQSQIDSRANSRIGALRPDNDYKNNRIDEPFINGKMNWTTPPADGANKVEHVNDGTEGRMALRFNGSIQYIDVFSVGERTKLNNLRQNKLADGSRGLLDADLALLGATGQSTIDSRASNRVTALRPDAEYANSEMKAGTYLMRLDWRMRDVFWRSGTTTSGGHEFIVNSPKAQTGYVYVLSKDSESGHFIALNGALAATLSGANNETKWYTAKVSFNSGNNTLRLYQNGSDGGQIRGIVVSTGVVDPDTAMKQGAIGAGGNLIHPAYYDPALGVIPLWSSNTAGATTVDIETYAHAGFRPAGIDTAYRIESTSNDAYMYFGKSSTDYNMTIPRDSKFLIGGFFYVQNNAGGNPLVQAYLRTSGNNHYGTKQVEIEEFEKWVWVPLGALNLFGDSSTKAIFRVDLDNAIGSKIYFAGLKVCEAGIDVNLDTSINGMDGIPPFDPPLRQRPITRGDIVPTVNAANGGSAMTSNPLSANGSTIEIAAHTVHYPDKSVNYGYGSLGSRDLNTEYWVYCNDLYRVGTNDYFAVKAGSLGTLTSSTERRRIGKIKTPSSAGGSSTPSPGDCVCEQMWLKDNLLAKDSQVGMESDAWSHSKGLHEGMIQGRKRVWVMLVELTTTSGAKTRVSDDTPVDLRDGTTEFADNVYGRELMTIKEDGSEVWERCIDVKYVGYGWAIRLDFGDTNYPSGFDPKNRVVTHNSTVKP